MTIDPSLEAFGTVISGSLTDSDGHIATVDAARRTQIDYYVPVGSTNYQPRYMGVAPQGTLDNVDDWVIKRLTWQTFGTEDKVIDIQILKGSWTNRDSLGWV